VTEKHRCRPLYAALPRPTNAVQLSVHDEACMAKGVGSTDVLVVSSWHQVTDQHSDIYFAVCNYD